MRKSALTAFGLIMASGPLVAQTAMSPAPIPGPYQIIIRPQAPAPAMRPQQQQPYRQPMPYWMQAQRPNGAQQNTTQAPTTTRAAPQPFISGWNWSQPSQGSGAPQGYGAAPTPGYFPGYGGVQNGQQTRQQRPAPNYGQPLQPYPRQNYGYAGQPWGQQGVMPWGNATPYGHGYQPGYGRPPQPQRQ
ncbi:hypothetical protein [Profundibacter sp.]